MRRVSKEVRIVQLKEKIAVGGKGVDTVVLYKTMSGVRGGEKSKSLFTIYHLQY